MVNRWLSLGMVAFVLSCGGPDEDAACKVVCTTDTDCPTGQTCGELGRCTDGQACPCGANEFLGCIESGPTPGGGDTAAQFCNDTGDGIATETCFEGCNPAGYCNTCVPNTEQCDGSGGIFRCESDGLASTTETCALPCTTTNGPVHCGYISPAYLPDVCDALATEESLELLLPTTLDTNLDTTCNGGVVAATMGEICVVRYGSITINTTARVTGARAIAFVADTTLTVAGEINASAIGGVSGAGGGRIVSGDRAVSARGGGGAGFRDAGANGGANASGDGAAGGPQLAISPETTGLVGGPRPLGPTTAQAMIGYPGPAGGGGAVLLITCRGTTTVSGTVAANGGGGAGGKQVTNLMAQTFFVGGGGGGAGGSVAVQGANVIVTGKVYANGGGGGGGCATTSCVGMAGSDGQRSTVPALGGVTGSEFGVGFGGSGGTNVAPTTGNGGASFGYGGGGGAAGYLTVFTPAGVTPAITPIEVSPPVSSTETITTR